jgi:low affinity Fe/Cu permease
MKKFLLSMALVVFIAGTLSTAYGQVPDKKSEKARENLQDAKKNVIVAKQDLKLAQKDSVSEYQKFKSETDLKFRDNEKNIADLKVKISESISKDRVTFQKNIGLLELKNDRMKLRLADYKDEGKTKWTTFKDEFNSDLDQIGKELKDFTVDNKI